MTRNSPRIRDRYVDPRIVKQMADKFANVGGLGGNLEDGVRELLAKRIIDPKAYYREIPNCRLYNQYSFQVGDLLTTGTIKADGTGYGTVLEVTRIIKRVTNTTGNSSYGGDELELYNLSTGKTSEGRHRSWMKRVELL